LKDFHDTAAGAGFYRKQDSKKNGVGTGHVWSGAPSFIHAERLMPRRFWSELVIEIALKAKFEKPVRTRLPLRLCRK